MCSRFGTLPPNRRRQTTSLRCRLYGSIPLSHLSSPSITAACQRLRSMTANAPFPLSSCYQKIQWNGPPHLTHYFHRRGRSTNPMKANPIQSDIPENSLKSSPSPLSPPYHTKPLTPRINVRPRHSIHYSKPLPLTPSPLSTVFPSAGKRQSRRSFVSNYPLPPISMLVRSSSASSSILPSSSSSEMNHSRHPSQPPQPLSTSVHHTPQPHPHLADPPPCSSIPADRAFEMDDRPSVFSLSLYGDDLDLSACSFSSEPNDFRFDVDFEMDVGG